MPSFNRKYRNITEVTSEFRLPKDEVADLSRSTRAFLRDWLRKHPSATTHEFEDVVKPLAIQWLEDHGSHYFSNVRGRYLWPQHRDRLIQNMIEILGRQFVYDIEKSWLRKRVRQNSACDFVTSSGSSQSTSSKRPRSESRSSSISISDDDSEWHPIATYSDRLEEFDEPETVRVRLSDTEPTPVPVSVPVPVPVPELVTVDLAHSETPEAELGQRQMTDMSTGIEDSPLPTLPIRRAVSDDSSEYTNESLFTFRYGFDQVAAPGDKCAKILEFVVMGLLKEDVEQYMAGDEGKDCNCGRRRKELLKAVDKMVRDP